MAILASGTGTNAQAIFEKIRAGSLEASVELVIANKPHAGVLERAAKAGIRSIVVEPRNFPDRDAYDAHLVELLLKAGCDLVVLAGYMLLLGDVFFEAFAGRMVNIHPSLLPSFPGMAGIASALTYGVKLTGPSVHFVEKEVDSGPLIIQAAVPVKADEPLEELANRIHWLEHRIYPQALQWLAEGRLKCVGRQVILAPGGKKQIKPDGDWLVWPPLEEGF